MRICSMVIDNLDWVNYRVEYVSERLKIFDLVIWFGGDAKQCELLTDKKRKCSHPNIEIVNIEHKINNGADFATMQDKSFQYIKKHYPNFSICAFQSADELLTDFGIQEVENWIVNKTDEKFALFSAMSNKMFCETFIAQLVFQIFRGGVEYRSNNGVSDNIRYCDGVDMNANMYHTNLGHSDQEDKNYVIDVGYINPFACYQKICNWARLCYGDGNTPYLKYLYNSGQYDLFVTEFVRLHRGEFHGATDKKVTLFKYEGEYKRLIDDLGMYDEYLKIKNILQ